MCGLWLPPFRGDDGSGAIGSARRADGVIMEPKKFRVYYEDGSTYDGDPFDAPATGVQVITQEDPARTKGFRLFTSKDAYCYKDGNWFQCDTPGMFDYLMGHPGPLKVLFGRMMVRDEEYYKIVNRAKEEGLG